MTTTMDDLYPDGKGYHQAHEPYMRAVAAALEAAGVKVIDWYADPNDPRDGGIQVDTDDLAWDEVWLGWQEERGWTLLLIDERDNGQEPNRLVRDLAAGTVFSPESVVRAYGQEMGVAVDPPADRFPDVDFPQHEAEEDNVELEEALRRYAEAAP
jgi:hypothetical protein